MKVEGIYDADEVAQYQFEMHKEFVLKDKDESNLFQSLITNKNILKPYEKLLSRMDLSPKFSNILQSKLPTNQKNLTEKSILQENSISDLLINSKSNQIKGKDQRNLMKIFQKIWDKKENKNFTKNQQLKYHWS